MRGICLGRVWFISKSSATAVSLVITLVGRLIIYILSLLTNPGDLYPANSSLMWISIFTCLINFLLGRLRDFLVCLLKSVQITIPLSLFLEMLHDIFCLTNHCVIIANDIIFPTCSITCEAISLYNIFTSFTSTFPTFSYRTTSYLPPRPFLLK